MNAKDWPVPVDVRRIAVLGPAPVGDFVFTLPMLHALRRRFSGAEILYLGRQWQADFLTARPCPVDRVVEMPLLPGLGLPPAARIDTAVRERCADAMRAQAVDVAIQAYGGGRYSNPFVASFGARFTVGLRAPDTPPLDRWVSYVRWQNRRLQLLEVAALVGAAEFRVGRELEVTRADGDEAARVLPATQGRPLVVLQPGATDARRRWPARRFAQVADVLADEGATVAVNGTESEAAVVGEVVAAARRPLIDLCGRLSLGGLCGLLERAALLVSNDTGPLHLALAIGTPAVGIYWFTNAIESMPLRQDIHRAAISTRLQCPVCGMENVTERCPHDESFVDGVRVEEVIQSALELLRARSSRRA